MRAALIRLAAVLVLAFAGALPLATALAPGALAQEQPAAPDYEAWSDLAGRAEDIILAGRASTEAFESLRAELVAWRERFLAAQNVNAARIETLQEQIDALGPPPAEGEAEATELTERRADLNQQMSELAGPRLRAEEAFTRAEGLIREIDSLVRERQADEFTSLGPSPVNPAHWAPALSHLSRSLHGIWVEIQSSWRSEVRRTAFRSDLPRIGLLLLIAALLVLRGRATMEWLTGLVIERSAGQTRELAGLVVSLGQVIVPVLGLTLLAGAMRLSGLMGLRGEVVAAALPAFGLALFGGRWLAVRLFPYQPEVSTPIPLPPEERRRARLVATLIGLLVGLAVILSQLAEHESWGEEILAVVFFPFFVLLAPLLARLGAGLRRAAAEAEADARETGFRARGFTLVGRAASLVAIAGPLAAAIGFYNAAGAITYPFIGTLALLGLLLVLNGLILQLHALVTRRTVEESRDALVPILFSFAMVVASLPLFALMWGARETDIAELWVHALEGFTVGEIRISASSVLVFTIIFVAGFLLTRLLQGALKNSILPKTRLDVGGRTAVTSGIGYVGIFLAALVAITSAGIDLSSLAIVAGALSVGIGFGLQTIVQNFVSGIILLIERPIAEGDWIEVGPHMGIVRSISVRSTTIETFDKTRVIVPNGDFVSGAVTNWTRGNQLGRALLTVGVAYGTDTRRVERILLEVAHNHPIVALSPEPAVDFMGFGADSLDFRVRVILSDVNFLLSVKTELYHQIAERFKEEGIEIPFAQRDVWLRNPETLRGAPTTPTVAADPVPAPPSPPRAERFDTDDLRPGDGDAEGDEP